MTNCSDRLHVSTHTTLKPRKARDTTTRHSKRSSSSAALCLSVQHCGEHDGITQVGFAGVMCKEQLPTEHTRHEFLLHVPRAHSFFVDVLRCLDAATQNLNTDTRSGGRQELKNLIIRAQRIASDRGVRQAPLGSDRSDNGDTLHRQHLARKRHVATPRPVSSTPHGLAARSNCRPIGSSLRPSQALLVHTVTGTFRGSS